MTNAPNAPANAGVTLPDAEEIIRRQRKAHGKPVSYRPRATDLVRDNEPVIRQLRDAGYKQEDAVLLLLELGNDGHQPDTLRKAIAAVLGAWSKASEEPAPHVDVAEPDYQHVDASSIGASNPTEKAVEDDAPVHGRPSL
jgi:hypothetical protein